MNKDAYIAQLEQQNSALLAQVASLTNQVENLTEMLMQMRRDKFGPSSEKTPKEELDGQVYFEQIFNEIELEAKESEDPCKITKAGNIRAKSKGTRKEILLKDIPIVEKVYAATEQFHNAFLQLVS